MLLAFQLLAMIGVAFALAAVGAYLRDAKDFVQLFAMMGVYLLPRVYLPEWVPTLFKPLLYLNPFSYMVWGYQDALYFGRFQHPWAWGVFAAGSVFVFSPGTDSSGRCGHSWETSCEPTGPHGCPRPRDRRRSGNFG